MLITKPKPQTREEVRQRVVDDQVSMCRAAEPVTGPITFYEAAARALKYNLDYRLKLMESALAANLRDVSTNEMLPQLVARRDIRLATTIGRNVDRHRGPAGELAAVHVGAAISQTREPRDDLELLDFGVAYYRTQQRSDQMLMAEERRRKVAQNVFRTCATRTGARFPRSA